MLPFFDVYLHAKNLRDYFIPCRGIDDQRILQSDCLRAFKAITEESDFSQACRFCRMIMNTVTHHFLDEKDSSMG